MEKTAKCDAPFHAINHEAGGWKICYQHHVPMHKELTMEEWWNSDVVCRTRKGLVGDAELTDTCKQCINKSQSGEIFEGIEEGHYNAETGEYTAEPKALGFLIGNKCDCACVMCRPDESDMVAKTFPNRKPVLNIKDRTLRDYEVLKKFPKANVWIHGGEPFLFRNIYDILSTVYDNRHGAVTIITNANRPLTESKTFMELVTPNKHRTHMVVSVDGIKEINDKQRLFSKHEVALGNIQYLLDEGFGVTISHTLTSINLGYFYEFLVLLNDRGWLFRENFNIIATPASFVDEGIEVDGISDEGLRNAQKNFYKVVSLFQQHKNPAVLTALDNVLQIQHRLIEERLS